MSTTPSPTFGAVRAPIVDENGMPSLPFLKKLQEYETKLSKAITLIGQISAQARIQGRSEGIGTTVSKLTSIGKLASTDSIAADGLGSPLAGGTRAFQALDSNNRLASSFHDQPLTVSVAPSAATVLSNDGISTAIPIASSTMKYGFGDVSYNSGSVDPGSFGTWYIYADDPTFSGGAVSYQFTSDPSVLTASDQRISFGGIKTTGGTPGTGGGNTGGTSPGGKGGGGFPVV